MNSKIIIKIAVLASLAIYGALLAYQPLRRKSLRVKAGNLIRSTKENIFTFTVISWIVFPVFFILCLFVKLGVVVTVVMCGAGILGMITTCKEDAVCAESGIYDAGFINCKELILFDEIESINPPDKKYPFLMVLKMKSGKNLMASFMTEEDFKIAQDALFARRPDLR